MRILIDGDACPVVNIIKNIALEYKINVILFIDEAHECNDSMIEVFRCQTGANSVDNEIFYQTLPNDIIVTNDYGLANLALSKQGKVINFNGNIINDINIDHYLLVRAINQKLRKKHIYGKGPKKRQSEDDLNFTLNLRQLLDNACKN